MPKKSPIIQPKATDNLPMLWEEQLARDAVKDVARATIGSSGRNISTRGKDLQYQGMSLAVPLELVVVDWTYMFTYYKNKFDPENPTPPSCFAISDTEAGLIPDPSSPEMQGSQAPDDPGDDPSCKNCWANGFGSADVGRGKACRNGVKAAVIDVEGQLEMAGFLGISPNGLGNWSGLIKGLGNVSHLPVYAAILEADFDPKFPAFPVMKFKVVRAIKRGDDDVLIRRILDAQAEVKTALREAPDVSSYSFEAPAPRPAAGRQQVRRPVNRPAPSAPVAAPKGKAGAGAPVRRPVGR